MPASFPLLLDAHRAVPGTLVPRSVSGSCWTERCSPWPAPFPPLPPLKIAPLCSAGSSVLRRGPTPLERAGPLYGYSPIRTGLDSGWIEKPRRSPGSRACCFSACAGSKTTQSQPATRDLTRIAVLPSPFADGVGALVQSFSKLNTRPTDAAVYASRAASRRPVQNSRSGWSRFLLSCRALSSPTTCRFIPAHPQTGFEPATLRFTQPIDWRRVQRFRLWFPRLIHR